MNAMRGMGGVDRQAPHDPQLPSVAFEPSSRKRIACAAHMRIGYLASHYPAVAHAFLLREVRALRAAAVEVETFSIHRAPPEELLAIRDREEAERTYAVLPARPAALVLTHLLALLRAPQRYLSTLA